VSRQLRIDRKLAWQFRRFVFDTEPLSAAQHLPGANGLHLIYRSLERVLGGCDLIDRLRTAIASLEQLEHRHANGRSELLRLLHAAGSPVHGPRLEDRRDAFEANGAMWGIRCAAYSRTDILAPGPDDQVAVCVGRSFIGLQRLRADVRWPLGRIGIAVPTPACGPFACKSEPVEAEAAQEAGGVPVVPDFCSYPLPKLTREPAGEGLIADILEPGPVGRMAAVDLVLGERNWRAGWRYRIGEHGGNDSSHVAIRLPMQHFVLDLLIHRDLDIHSHIRHAVYSELFDHAWRCSKPINRLPIDLPIIRFDPAGAGPALPMMPSQDPLRFHLLGRCGWNPRDFAAFRIEWEYPIMSSVIWINLPLPTPPEGWNQSAIN
jgi:hypothetical protein